MTFKAHFGHITYDVTYTDQEIEDPDREEHEPPAVGLTHHLERRIEVLFTDEMAQEYAANTLLHEILHATCNAIGFHPHNEEEAVSAMTAGLMLFLRDRRNEKLIGEILGFPHAILQDRRNEKLIGEILAPPNPRLIGQPF